MFPPARRTRQGRTQFLLLSGEADRGAALPAPRRAPSRLRTAAWLVVCARARAAGGGCRAPDPRNCEKRYGKSGPTPLKRQGGQRLNRHAGWPPQRWCRPSCSGAALSNRRLTRNMITILPRRKLGFHNLEGLPCCTARFDRHRFNVNLSPAVAMCGGGGQQASMCGAPATSKNMTEKTDWPIAPQAQAEQKSGGMAMGGCSCCKNMAMMDGMKSDDPHKGMDMQK